jgi:hypothetical protein
MDSQMGKHVYCIIESGEEERFPIEGVGGEGSDIYSVPAGDIAAVVGEDMTGSPLTMDKKEIVNKLVDHQSVVEEVMKDHTVLPVKFGTTARDNDEVISILLQGAGQFRRLLDNIRGKTEIDVVAFWSKKIFEDVLREEQEIKEVRDMVASHEKDVSLEDSVKVGQMVAEALAVRKAKFAYKIINTLGNYSLDMRQNRIARDDMIINTAFLIERENQDVFDEKVMKLNDDFNDRVDFRCVGPLPAYSFSTVEVSRYSFEEIEAALQKLGLDSNADMSAAKEAHTRLIPQLHPDKRQNDPEAARKFEEVTKAYQLLNRYFHQGGKSLRKEDVESMVMVNLLEIDSL